MYSMRFDMRAPEFGAAPTELYEAAVDMCEWAETRGCLAAVICEHHSSPDGYLPTPLILGSAIAARTEQLVMTLIAILPFYDPVRLAEEIAVLDIISKGRAAYVFGLGYRPEEYQHFGLDRKARGRIADEKLGLLRRLLAGEVVEHDGRRIRLTPLPFSPNGPLMMWGGGSPASRTVRARLSRPGQRARLARGLRRRLPRPRPRTGDDAAAQSGYAERLFRSTG